MKFTVLLVALPVALLGALAQLPLGARAQTPGATGTPTAHPAVALRRPGNLMVYDDRVTWSDQSDGEDGYRVTVVHSAGGPTETRTFMLPANSTVFYFPADFRPGCNMSGLGVTVAATRGTDVGESALGSGGAFDCWPGLGATSTPAPAASPAPRLPSTGIGARAGSRNGAAGAGMLAGLAVILASAAFVLSVRRASRP